MDKDLSDFSSFILSLASSASYYMGDNLPGTVPTEEIDLNIASYNINTIEMLKGKTEGNLTEKEKNLINDVLYRLRLRFVELSKKS